MAIIDWSGRLITITQADMVLGSGVYQLDLDALRRNLRELEASVEGVPWPATHAHNTAVQVGQTIYARTILFVNGYTVQFEDAGTYAVNVTGGNSNLSDVLIPQPGVAVSFNNSAGLTEPPAVTAQAIASAVWDALLTSHSGPGSTAEAVQTAANLLDSPQAAHTTPGSVGESIDVAAGLLDAPQNVHEDPGTVGESISLAAAGANAGPQTAPHISVSYDDGSQLLHVIVWLAVGSVLVNSPTAMALTWRDADGNVRFTRTEADAVLTSAGFYSMTYTYPLVEDVLYFVELSIDDATGTYTATHSVSTS